MSTLHTGRTVLDLCAEVDNVLALEAKRKAERLSKLCGRCRAAYGQHSAIAERCPNPGSHGPLYLRTTFREMVCQASVGVDARQCEKSCVAGTDMCREHTEV